MIQIKSKGYIKQNDNNHVEGMKWNADYDGNKANILLDLNHHGHVQRRKIQLHNKELGTLAKLLSVPSVNKPLEKRIFDDYEEDEDDVSTNMFQNYISTPRRMKRRNPPQIIRINLEPMEQEFPDFYENEEEEEENEEPNDPPPQEIMMMNQLLNEITAPTSPNRSHTKKPKHKKNPTRKVRFSPRRNSSRTKKPKYSYGGKKHNTRRRLKR